MGGAAISWDLALRPILDCIYVQYDVSGAEGHDRGVWCLIRATITAKKQRCSHMSAKFFEYRDFEVTAFAEQSFTGLWIAKYHAFPCAESAKEVLSFRFLCDGRKHRLVRNDAEAVDEAAAFARAAIDTKLLMASLPN